MGAKIFAGLILAVVLLASLCIGIGFAADAIETALTPSLGMAGAAAITAVILLLPSILGVATALLLQASSARRRRERRLRETEEAVISVLSFIAGERSWIAIAAAALVGAASALFRKSRK